MEREGDVRALREFISKMVPHRKLGYMRKKSVIRAGESGGVQGQS
jgi:hypothetical protein